MNGITAEQFGLLVGGMKLNIGDKVTNLSYNGFMKVDTVK